MTSCNLAMTITLQEAADVPTWQLPRAPYGLATSGWSRGISPDFSSLVTGSPRPEAGSDYIRPRTPPGRLPCPQKSMSLDQLINSTQAPAGTHPAEPELFDYAVLILLTSVRLRVSESLKHRLSCDLGTEGTNPVTGGIPF